jgi:hypothetical protein
MYIRYDQLVWRAVRANYSVASGVAGYVTPTAIIELESFQMFLYTLL